MFHIHNMGFDTRRFDKIYSKPYKNMAHFEIKPWGYRGKDHVTKSRDQT